MRKQQVVAVLLLTVCGPCLSAGEERRVSASEVVSSIQEKTKQVVTLRVAYACEYESPLGDAVLFEQFEMLPSPPSRTEAVYHADGRT